VKLSIKRPRHLALTIANLGIANIIITLVLIWVALVIKDRYFAWEFLPLLLLVSVGALLISLVAGYFHNRQIQRLLTEITLAIRQLTVGNYDLRFTPSRYEKINRLLLGLRQMADLLQHKFTQLQRENSWLTAVMNKLQEGILILGAGGKVVFANNSCQRMLGVDSANDKFYWQIIRHPQFINILKQLTPTNPQLTIEIVHNDRRFLLNALYSTTGEQIITFSDITELTQTAEMKRNFVYSVSHELRTPLTAIKGYLETMAETVEPHNQHYLMVIKRNTDRLINIVNDLLTLSRLETPVATSEKEWEEIEIPDLINDVAIIFQSAVQQKGLKLHLQLPPVLPKIKGDRLYLEQVLINLLDNAVRYTEKGEITVATEIQDGKLLLSVHDTGIGIDPAHLPRIFERFYVIDRTRSRQTGGTGLGLAIVKHIIALHHGEIKVTSTPGAGSKFTIILPISR